MLTTSCCAGHAASARAESGRLNRPVVAAVAVVLVVQMAANEVIDVVAVRDGLVPALRSVDVPGVVL